MYSFYMFASYINLPWICEVIDTFFPHLVLFLNGIIYILILIYIRKNRQQTEDKTNFDTLIKLHVEITK